MREQVSLLRREIIKKSQRYFGEFINLVEAYGIISKTDYTVFLEIVKGSKVKSGRDEKIAAFKRRKASEIKIKQLFFLVNSELDENKADKDAMDGVARELELAQIDLYIQLTLQTMSELESELEMIAYALSQSQQRDRKEIERMVEGMGGLEVQGERKPTQYQGPLLSKTGKPLRPFVITSGDHDKRSEFAGRVFGQGHSLPTMTIEEYLDREFERGNFLSGGTERPEKVQVDDNDYLALDQETEKKREWDEFKDYNPAGWGNRHNKG